MHVFHSIYVLWYLLNLLRDFHENCCEHYYSSYSSVFSQKVRPEAPVKLTARFWNSVLLKTRPF